MKIKILLIFLLAKITLIIKLSRLRSMVDWVWFSVGSYQRL